MALHNPSSSFPLAFWLLSTSSLPAQHYLAAYYETMFLLVATSLPAHYWLSATYAFIITLLAAGPLLLLYYLAHRSPALQTLDQFYTSSPLAPLIP